MITRYTFPMPENRWISADHVQEYLGIADSVPHRSEGEATLLEFLPPQPRRILDLGTGDGRLLALVKRVHPQAESVGLDFSPAMLERARQRFAADRSISIVTHDLDHPLPELGKFDAGHLQLRHPSSCPRTQAGALFRSIPTVKRRRSFLQFGTRSLSHRATA